MSEKVYPPMKLLKDITHKYQGIWELFELYIDGNKRRDYQLWDKDIYIPRESVEFILEQHRSNSNLHRYDLVYEATKVMAIANWRQYKYVYKFDEELMNLLFLQAEDFNELDRIPSSVLDTLPYPCIFIECALQYTPEKTTHGFFLYKSRRLDEKGINRLALMISFLFDDGKVAENYVFLDKDESVKECINVVEMELEEYYEELKEIYKFSKEEAKELIKQTKPYRKFSILKAIQLILYICAQNAEVTENPEQARIYKPKEQGKKDKFTDIKKWDVGVRIGQEIRMLGKIGEVEKELIEETGSLIESRRNPMRPHTRRGHWHHFWTGSRSNPEERKLILKWIAPTMINVRDADEDLPVVKSNMTI